MPRQVRAASHPSETARVDDCASRRVRGRRHFVLRGDEGNEVLSRSGVVQDLIAFFLSLSVRYYSRTLCTKSVNVCRIYILCV